MAGRGGIRKNIDRFNSVKERNVGPKGTSVLKNGDARLKIIQKNRSKLVDARDRLAQMAKKTDARSKLVKLRQMRKGISTLNMDLVQPVGKSILKKTDRNGKISLSTNKAKTPVNQTDINTAIRKELGLVAGRKKISHIRSPKTQHPKQLRNNRLSLSTLRKPHSVNESLYHRTLEMDTVYARPPPVIQRTIHNDIREVPVRELPYNHAMEHNFYSWIRPEASLTGLDSRRQSMKVIAKNNMPTVDLTGEWSYADPSLRSIKMSPYFIDDEMEDLSPSCSSPMQVKTGVHARLDTPAIPGQSQGIFSQAKTKVVVPVGHRIVVSNLQPTVTQDDIRELFEDVGELLVSRLVRPGTAEVIYKNLKDAQKAVDTYHNRQLDGQPMKCLLVNKRPINNPTAPAVRTAKTTSSVLRTNGGIVKKTIVSSKSSSKLVPDINTIHKVLFHKT